MLDGDRYLFVFEDNSIDEAVIDTDSKADNSSIADEILPSEDENEKSGGNLKAALIVGVLILIAFLFLVLFISKKNKKV
jgi:hypothetical protein